MKRKNVKQDLANRPRKIDIEKLSNEEVDRLSKRIGEKVGDAINTMCDSCKKFLSVYGLDIKVAYILHEVGKDPLESVRVEQKNLQEYEAVSGKKVGGAKKSTGKRKGRGKRAKASTGKRKSAKRTKTTRRKKSAKVSKSVKKGKLSAKKAPPTAANDSP